MVLEKFEADLDSLLRKLGANCDLSSGTKLKILRDKLVRLHKENMVKINHSVMELVCAKYLVLSGYEVDVERFLDGLSCDIYALKGLGSLIVEVETGFVPPDHALDPLTYCKARIASKITRYSGYADKFSLASPPHYIMQIPQALTKPPRFRADDEIAEIKRLCDLYYKNPPVSLKEIRNARLHTIYIVDVDRAEVIETDPMAYSQKSEEWRY
ncbi:MAG: hypothetical protein ACE5NN_01580 [Candidatus Bathyarchaeia archaeon]